MHKKEIKLNSELKYRRQFIATPKPNSHFQDWQRTQLLAPDLYIYAHPALGLNTIEDDSKNVKIVLLGYIIDPDKPNKSDFELLEDILNDTNSLDDFSEQVIKLAGRFVIILKIEDQIYFFNDAGGLRSIFYATDNGEKYIATQPLLFKQIFQLEKSDNYNLYIKSEHYAKDVEYWLPSGITLYDNVKHVIPNHYLSFSTFEQKRYYPSGKLGNLSLEEGTKKSAEIIRNLIYAVSTRYNLALPLTAGIDSRILLGAARYLEKDPFFYTLLYSRHDKTSYDIAIPKHISRKTKKKHHIINCQSLPDQEFLDFYKNNMYLSHVDWAKNLYALFGELPENCVDIKGNVSEIARCVLFPDGVHPEITSLDQIDMYVDEFREMPFVMDFLQKWFDDALLVSKESGYDILDLFYWEIKTGSWYAQANNETDILTETFTPFNFRPLLEVMLAVPAIHRQRDASVMHKKIAEFLWPELMYWPVNRRWNGRDKFTYYMADKLKKVGLFESGKKVYKKIHKSYLNLKSL